MKKLLFGLVFIASISFTNISNNLYAVGAMSQKTLENQVRYLVRDLTPANYTWSEELIDERLAMAEVEFCTQTEAVREHSYVATASSQALYGLPSNWIATYRVSRAIFPLSGKSLSSGTTAYKALEYVTKDALDVDSKRPYFENASPSTPERYYIDLSSRCLGLDPAPDYTYTGTNYIKHEYAIISSTMGANTDLPFDGQVHLIPYHKALIYYVVSLCRYDMGDSEGYKENLAIFENYVDRAKKQIASRLHGRGKQNHGGFTAQ